MTEARCEKREDRCEMREDRTEHPSIAILHLAARWSRISQRSGLTSHISQQGNLASHSAAVSQRSGLISRLLLTICIGLISLLQTPAQQNQSPLTLPSYQKNYIGLSYQQYNQSGRAILFSFHDHDPRFGNTNFHVHLFNNPFEVVKERYQNLVLSGNYYLNKQLALLFEVPYKVATRYFEEDVPYRLQGMGDIQLGLRYHLFDSKLFNPKASAQHLSSLNVSVKFKTGKYNIANDLNDIDPYLQPGTGSFDVSASLQQQLIFNRFHLNAAFSYYYKGISYYQLKFGNRYTVQLNANYAIIKKPNLQLQVFSGVTYAKKQVDVLEEKPILRPNQYTEIFYTAGFLTHYQNWAFVIKTSLPVYVEYDAFAMRWKSVTSFTIFYSIN